MNSPSKRPLVAVVTPFYNTAEYLAECIESVLLQEYSDFEYILYDNASTDGSSEIAKSYAARDERIRYIRSETLVEQVPNYNRALQCISRESVYCKIVQADDWIDPACLLRMVSLAETDSTIGIVSAYMLEGSTIKCVGLPYGETIHDGREIARRHLFGEFYLFGSPTSILVRSQIILARESFFHEGRYHEDAEACYEILASWNFGFVHQVLTFSRFRPDSIYGRMRSMDSVALAPVVFLRTYGPSFLSREQFNALWKADLRSYYSRLGNAALTFRGEEYWSFHREGLASVGMRIEWWRVIGAMLRQILRTLLCPLTLIKRTLNLFRGSVRAVSDSVVRPEQSGSVSIQARKLD